MMQFKSPMVIGCINQHPQFWGWSRSSFGGMRIGTEDRPCGITPHARWATIVLVPPAAAYRVYCNETE